MHRRDDNDTFVASIYSIISHDCREAILGFIVTSKKA